MSTVFISSIDPLRDYSPANSFGRLVEVLPGVRQLFGDAESTKSFTATIASVMADASKDDYLLLNGDPVIIAACAAEFHRRTGTLNMLKFDRRIGKSGGYHNVVMQLQK